MNTQPLPTAPVGWQYGVIMTSGRVWGCGSGEAGRVRQRMRLNYSTTAGPCLLPCRFERPLDETETTS